MIVNRPTVLNHVISPPGRPWSDVEKRVYQTLANLYFSYLQQIRVPDKEEYSWVRRLQPNTARNAFVLFLLLAPTLYRRPFAYKLPSSRHRRRFRTFRLSVIRRLQNVRSQ